MPRQHVTVARVIADLERVAISQAAIEALHAAAAERACENQAEQAAQSATPPTPGGGNERGQYDG